MGMRGNRRDGLSPPNKPTHEDESQSRNLHAAPPPILAIPPDVALSPAFRRRRHAVVNWNDIFGADDATRRRRRRRADRGVADGG